MEEALEAGGRWKVGLMGDGIEEGGVGNAEKLIALSAMPDALVSREGRDTWRWGRCQEAEGSSPCGW